MCQEQSEPLLWFNGTPKMKKHRSMGNTLWQPGNWKDHLEQENHPQVDQDEFVEIRLPEGS